jgi:hypothetical protein
VSVTPTQVAADRLAREQQAAHAAQQQLASMSIRSQVGGGMRVFIDEKVAIET